MLSRTRTHGHSSDKRTRNNNRTIKKSTRNRRRNSKRIVQLHPAVLAKINPFLSGCAGMRSPDDFGYPTGTGEMRNSYGLPQTNGFGYSAAIYTPFVNTGQFVPASIGSGGVITWAAGATTGMSQATSLANISSAYRTVGWGIRITTDLSLTNASGHIWVGHFPLNSRSNNWPYYGCPVTEAQVAGLPLSEKFSLVELAERPIIVPGRAFDDGIYRFRDSQNISESYSATFIESTPGWCGIIVYAAGLPASTSTYPLNIEVVNHVEYLQYGTSLYGFIDTIPGVYDAEAMDLGSRVEAAAPVGIIETMVSTVESAVATAGSVIAGAARISGAVSSAYHLAAQAAKARGALRGPASSPFARLEYKSDY